jgi:predicted cupin superfamily sugar epimerase
VFEYFLQTIFPRPFISANGNLTCRSYPCIPDQSLIADLNLQPHLEGRYYREIFCSESRVQPDDHRAERSALTAIYILLVAGQHSGWHQVLEVWSHLEGDALELLCFDATNSQASTLALGRFSASGAAPIHDVPAGVWQAARPLGEYAL